MPNLARDDRGSSNFQNTSTKRFIFEKISARDDRGSSNFQLTSTKRFIFAKIPPRDNRGSANFQNYINKTALFLRKFQLVIIGAGRIFR